MNPVPDLASIAAAGVELHERFVADCVAMDCAWKAGTYDEWLAAYRKRSEEEFYGVNRKGEGEPAVEEASTGLGAGATGS